MSAALRKQDMPPAGGYAPIVFKRIPAKSYFNGYTLIAMYLGVTSVSLGLYAYTYYKRNREIVEMRSARFAILPLLMAEKDREFLKQLRRNRDAETDLMKNVKGWEVGKLYGEPLYRSVGDDFLADPSAGQYYVHTDRSSYNKRFFLHSWT